MSGFRYPMKSLTPEQEAENAAAEERQQRATEAYERWHATLRGMVETAFGVTMREAAEGAWWADVEIPHSRKVDFDAFTERDWTNWRYDERLGKALLGEIERFHVDVARDLHARLGSPGTPGETFEIRTKRNDMT